MKIYDLVSSLTRNKPNQQLNTIVMIKYTPMGLLVAFLLLAMAPLSAQGELSREEIKEWKTKAKEYRRNLPALKMLVEEHEQYQDQVVDLQRQVAELQSQLSLAERQITSFEEQQAELNQRLVMAETAARTAVNQPTPPPPVTTPKASVAMGTVFRVQIGAFQAKKMDASLASGNNIAVKEEGGLQKVMVGELSTYENAKRLRDKLRQIGVKGAFVVATKDGVPIDVKTAVQYTGETIE